MAQPWFSQLFDLIQPLVEEMGAGTDADLDIECTHFFSGAAIYVNGQICMSLTPVGFALKLPDAAGASLLSAGGRPLRLFPSGPIKKGYVLVPDLVSSDVDELTALMRTCIGHAVAG